MYELTAARSPPLDKLRQDRHYLHSDIPPNWTGISRLIGRVSKFDHISAYMRDVVHSLPLRQRIEFRVRVLVWYSLIGQAPAYLIMTFVAPPLALGAPFTFARLSRASFISHLLAPPPCRAGPSPWLALWYGMVSHWLSGHFLRYSPGNSFSNLKQHYLAALGLGALLSSPT